MNEVPRLGEAAQRFMEQVDIQGRPGIGSASTVTKLVGGDRSIDAGIVALVVDLVAGHFILSHGWPCGISTTNITVTGVDRLRGPGLLVAASRLVSMTNRRGCVEVDLSIDGRPVSAVATATFNLFRFEHDAPAAAPPGPWVVGTSSRSLDEALWRTVGIDVDRPSGRSRVDLRPEIANHVDSLQGGVTAALLEAAALSRCPPHSTVSSMVLTYLSQGRVGPFEAEARPAGPDPAVIVVSATDTGNERRPVAHAVFGTVPPTPGLVVPPGD